MPLVLNIAVNTVAFSAMLLCVFPKTTLAALAAIGGGLSLALSNLFLQSFVRWMAGNFSGRGDAGAGSSRPPDDLSTPTTLLTLLFTAGCTYLPGLLNIPLVTASALIALSLLAALYVALSKKFNWSAIAPYAARVAVIGLLAALMTLALPGKEVNIFFTYAYLTAALYVFLNGILQMAALTYRTGVEVVRVRG